MTACKVFEHIDPFGKQPEAIKSTVDGPLVCILQFIYITKSIQYFSQSRSRKCCFWYYYADYLFF